MKHLTVLLLLGASAACGARETPTAEPRSAAPPEDASQRLALNAPREAPSAAPFPTVATTVEPPGIMSKSAAAPSPLVPMVRVVGENGEHLDRAQAAFQPARQRMRECSTGKRGVLQIRIRTAQNRTSLDVDPSSSVDAMTSRCVLQSLSTVDVDDALNQGSPSDRPSKSFTPVVRVEW